MGVGDPGVLKRKSLIGLRPNMVQTNLFVSEHRVRAAVELPVASLYARYPGVSIRGVGGKKNAGRKKGGERVLSDVPPPLSTPASEAIRLSPNLKIEEKKLKLIWFFPGLWKAQAAGGLFKISSCHLPDIWDKDELM